jgi:hypothetical protein
MRVGFPERNSFAKVEEVLIHLLAGQPGVRIALKRLTDGSKS